MMKPLFLLLWAALLMLSACTAPIATDSASADSTQSDDTMAHEFALTSLNGQVVSLADLRGRWVIVNFWATWCGPCVDEMPYLQNVAVTHNDRLTVLGINMREERAVVQDFVHDQSIAFPVLLDPDDATLLAYSLRGLPLTVVVGPDGAVVLKQYGPLKQSEFDVWLSLRLGD